MAQRHHHYEQAFEQYLRSSRVPYVAVDEAKKALMPESTALRFSAGPGTPETALKSFDFVIYGAPGSLRAGDDAPCNLLIEVKGRRVGGATKAPGPPIGGRRTPRLESWVTLEDIHSLQAWSALFGPQFLAAFVFVYWCEEQPPDTLFQEIFEHRGRWYAVRAVTLDHYTRAMRTRSPRWGTVHLSTEVFERISQPLLPVDGRVRSIDERHAVPTFDLGPDLPALDA